MNRAMIALLTLALMAIPLAASAEGRGKGMRPGGPMMKKMLKEKVGLTDAQIDKIQKLHFEADRAKLDIHYEIQKARLDLRQILSADKPSKSQVFAQIDKIGALEIKLKKNRMGIMLEIRNMVTPEQWQKMEMLHAKHKKDKGKKRGHGGREGGPGPHGGMGGPGPHGDMAPLGEPAF